MADHPLHSPRSSQPLKRAALLLVHSLEPTGVFSLFSSVASIRALVGGFVVLNVWTLVLVAAMVFGLPLRRWLSTSTGPWLALAASVGLIAVMGVWLSRGIEGYRPRVEIGLQTDRERYVRQMRIAAYLGGSLLSFLLAFYIHANWL